MLASSCENLPEWHICKHQRSSATYWNSYFQGRIQDLLSLKGVQICKMGVHFVKLTRVSFHKIAHEKEIILTKRGLLERPPPNPPPPPPPLERGMCTVSRCDCSCNGREFAETFLLYSILHSGTFVVRF